MSDEQHLVTFEGNPAIASALTQLLTERGVRVEWERPEERRDVAGAAQDVIVSIVSYGGIEAIKGAIAEFRKRFPRARADVDDDDHTDSDTPSGP